VSTFRVSHSKISLPGILKSKKTSENLTMNPTPLIRSVRSFNPKFGKGVFLAETAQLIGDVELGDECSVWYQVVLRADVNFIRVGKQTNIQDGTVIHATFEDCGTEIGDRVTIGHKALLHGCKIGNGSLIGMGSIVMDHAEVGEHSLVGAGSLLTEGSVFPPKSLILGRPAKVKRELTPGEISNLEKSADQYLLYASWYK
jgi:carbonic anhydrase/acetyltransferase-like protein (isoleucine patch superfamily)